MPQFTDAEGKVWVVPKLSLRAIEHFEESTNLSFFEVTLSEEGTLRVPKATFLLGLLYSLLAGEAQKEGIGYSEFKARLDDGPVLMQAMNVMGVLIRDFFQKQVQSGPLAMSPETPGAGKLSTS